VFPVLTNPSSAELLFIHLFITDVLRGLELKPSLVLALVLAWLPSTNHGGRHKLFALLKMSAFQGEKSIRSFNKQVREFN